MKIRLDKYLADEKLVQSRSQAENYIKLGVVKVDGKSISKPGYNVSGKEKIVIEGDQYVSRAALKLASIAKQFELDFRGKTVLDVGSSTGGFTDYALQNGADKVVSVDIGTNQLHPTLRTNSRVELHEKTDIREFKSELKPDIITADVSFISLRQIMPSLKKFCDIKTELIMMLKPQFEAGKEQTNKGIIKNSSVRRQIIKDFETWLLDNGFILLDKSDSQVSGTKGNIERFYKLKCS